MLITVLAQTRQIDEIHATMVPKIVDSSTTIEHHDILQSIVGLDVVNKELKQREVTQVLTMLGFGAWEGLERPFLFEKPIIASRSNGTFKAPLSFGLWWGKIPL
jgi:hypothetical protein